MNMNQYINKGETLGKEGFTHFGDSTNQDSCSLSSISQDCIESAYCFIHQKLRVYEFLPIPHSVMISNMLSASMWMA